MSAAKYKNLALSVLSVFFFTSSILLIKSSAVEMGEFLAEKIVLLIRDTTSGVFTGWVVTALLQSSGAFDSIVVALVSGGVLRMSMGVAAVIGAEAGTTVTSLLVSVIGYVRKKSQLSASFNVSIAHFLYNVFTLLLFYPAELFFGVFSSVARTGSFIFVKATWLRNVPSLLDVAIPWVELLLENVPAWIGLMLGVAILVISLWGLEMHMTALFSMPRSWNIIRATFTKPLRAFAAGLLFTILVPSTSIMVSLLVPLAASGVIRADYYILPYILGANIGTVFDVMIAALATGDPVSLGIWLVHLTINVVGAAIFFPLLQPFSSLVRYFSGQVAQSPMRTLTFISVIHVIPVLIVLAYLIL